MATEPLPEAHCSECKRPLEYPQTMCRSCERHLVGYLCASRPDGPLIPPASFTDPCGHDKAVYSDGTIEDLDSRGG